MADEIWRLWFCDRDQRQPHHRTPALSFRCGCRQYVRVSDRRLRSPAPLVSKSGCAQLHVSSGVRSRTTRIRNDSCVDPKQRANGKNGPFVPKALVCLQPQVKWLLEGRTRRIQEGATIYVRDKKTSRRSLRGFVLGGVRGTPISTRSYRSGRNSFEV